MIQKAEQPAVLQHRQHWRLYGLGERPDDHHHELKPIGIQIKPKNLSGRPTTRTLYTGDFQLAYDAESGGPTPYFELRQWLYSANSAPIGQTASTNWERYANPAGSTL